MGAKNLETQLQEGFKKLLNGFKNKNGYTDQMILERIEDDKIELTINDNE